MKKLFNKTSIRFLVAVLVFVTLALLSWEIISTGLITYAGDNDLKFDNTSICTEAKTTTATSSI